MKPGTKLRIIFISVLLAGFFPVAVRAQELPEYEVKAAFLCNFARFVEWPTNTFQKANSPLVIGVFGDNPFRNYLDETAAKIGEINGHPLIVHKVTFTADLKNCQILFISSSLRKSDVSSLLKGLNGVLTVSDLDGFLSDGGIIRFFTENNMIRFDINPTAAKDAGLSISSKLRMLARKSQTSEANPYTSFLCTIFP